VRLGRTDGRVAVHSPGGVLRVEVAPDYALRLTGPVEEISRGTLSADLLARLGQRALRAAVRRRRPAERR
jgi:diaminopimelate epimerase